MSSDKRKWLWLSLALLSAPAALAGVAYWATGGWPEPKEMTGDILSGDWGAQPPEKRPDTLRILSYNMHYGVGAYDDFDRRRTQAELDEVLQGLIRLIETLQPDVVLLQEVDYDSARTRGMNQLRIIAKGAGLRYMAPVSTWKKGYVPFPYWPPSLHYGRIDSGQAVLSRFPIVSNRRLHLPKPQAKPFYYNLFYLNRTLQHVQVDVAGRILDVYNVHTEAYDQDNRLLHAQIIREKLKLWGGEWLVLAGDFNAIPPEATLRKDFPDEPETDMTSDRSISVLRKLGLREIIEESRYKENEQAALSFPAFKPNRRLDYLFFSKNFQMKEGRIAKEAGELSDHLPTFAVLKW